MAAKNHEFNSCTASQFSRYIVVRSALKTDESMSYTAVIKVLSRYFLELDNRCNVK